jgi:hypothetical protein
MKQSQKLAAITAALGLGVAVVAFAHPGQTGGRMGQHGGMQHQEVMEHGAKDMEHRGMGGGAEHGAGQQLITPEERTALQEKMRNARTPEERQRIATATRAKMQQRAQERGITLHEHGGLHAGSGPRSVTAPATENAR